ncbi:MAG TPA: AraC family transcriptional regulator ligand-binding domain-containing protein [Myxococcota bacterium]|nr:AraC family transcriptional regulator ligand-binding domain-containing protein [Myxococcota bacterium]
MATPAVTNPVLEIMCRAAERLGIPRAELQAAVVRQGGGQSLRMYVLAAHALTGDDSIGVKLAERTDTLLVEPIGYLLLSSPDLGTALHHLVRYVPTMRKRATQFRAQHGRQQMALLVEGLTRQWPCFVEYVCALVIRLARWITLETTLSPVAVTFAHTSSADLTAYRELFGHGLQFRQAESALIWSTEQLALRSFHASPLLHAAHEQIIARALRSPSGDLLLRQVRVHITAGLPMGAATLQRVARACALSPRTLQRRLRDLDTDFNSMLDAIRRERAIQLVRDRDVALAGVPKMVGFSDASALYRAFRRWTGTTPSTFRRRRR